MNRSILKSLPRTTFVTAALALALETLVCGPTSVHAQMIMGITTNSFVAGSSTNSLDVTLTNTSGSAVTIAGFSFEITAASSNVNFEDVTTSTVSVGYIFAGNSLFGPDISSGGMPGSYGQTISAADNFTTSNMGTTIAPARLWRSATFCSHWRRARRIHRSV